MSGFAEAPATMKRMLVHEFAALSGVTVRTLHHYDRLGLLKPQGRTQAGYRVYGESDLVRLEQIIVLKFLGLPLSRIRDLLYVDQANWKTDFRRPWSDSVADFMKMARAAQSSNCQ